MTYAELKARFPHASDAFIEANRSRTSALMEHSAWNDAVETHPAETRAPGKLHIRFISRRQRLCDPDNLSVKWLLDCLRYCGAIEGDEPEKITLEVQQEKVKLKSHECTIIEIHDTAR